jgi:hypothetical protein
VLLLVAACGPRDKDGLRTIDTSAGAAARALTPISIERTANRDLTGDGVPERLRVHAAGARFDSLLVQLEILDGRDGARLYTTRWNTRDYFKYEPAGGQPDSLAIRERVARRNIDRILSDNAFIAPRVTLADGTTEAIDTAVVRYHLQELDWRRAHGIADTLPTPPEAESQLGRERVVSAEERARTMRVANELQGHATFTYFEGGELTNTIAWSDREHAFVRIFSCC